MFDDRAVSEVLGYIIIFGIVITSVLLLSASGTTTLEEIRENEQASNAQRALDVLAENIASIYERNSPSRATEIDLGEFQLFYDDTTEIEVEVRDGSGNVEQFEHEARPIVLRSSDTTELVYEAGATFQTEREGGVMLRQPPFLISEARVNIPIVSTTAKTVEAVSGTSALMRGQSTNREVLYDPTTLNDPDELHLNITSPRAEIWERNLDKETPLNCDIPSGTQTVECMTSSPPEDIYVTLQEIELDILL